MPPYQPLLDGKAHLNVYEEQQFVARVVFGSTSIASYKGKDVDIVRLGAGQYRWTLPKAYREVLRWEHGWVRASGAILQARIISMDLTAGTVTFETVVNAGTATDPTSGDELKLVLGVTENYLNDKFGT